MMDQAETLDTVLNEYGMSESWNIFYHWVLGKTEFWWKVIFVELFLWYFVLEHHPPRDRVSFRGCGLNPGAQYRGSIPGLNPH